MVLLRQHGLRGLKMTLADERTDGQTDNRYKGVRYQFNSNVTNEPKISNGFDFLVLDGQSASIILYTVL